MKREIKFRGLRTDGKGWVYGDLISDVIGGNIHYYIKMLDAKRERVKRYSVGQFTGLKDKNGVEIYEGDIVQWYSGSLTTEGLPDNIKKQAQQSYHEYNKGNKEGKYDFESNGWIERQDTGIIVFYGASFSIHNEADIFNHLENSKFNGASYFGAMKINTQYTIIGNIHEQ